MIIEPKKHYYLLIKKIIKADINYLLILIIYF